MLNLPLHVFLTTAMRAVDLADAYLRDHQPTRIHAKGDRDMVTDVDIAVERLLRSFLAEATPEAGFFGEEEGGVLTDIQWLLDPIDGTANFVRGLPLYGVSLALLNNRRPIIGVISIPSLQQRYWALDQAGAWRNGRPITTANTAQLSEAIVAIGDYGTGPDAAARDKASIALHSYLAPRARKVRMVGTAALDLAWVADGSLDASITLGNQAWDMAAGALIAREAGATLMDTDGTPYDLDSRTTIAVAQSLREQLLAALEAATTGTSYALTRTTPQAKNA